LPEGEKGGAGKGGKYLFGEKPPHRVKSKRSAKKEKTFRQRKSYFWSTLRTTLQREQKKGKGKNLRPGKGSIHG